MGVSIVGIDDVPIAYYRAKLAQEAVMRAGELPFQYNRARPGHRVPIALSMVGSAGRALKRGALTCADPDHRGTVGFAAWLAVQGQPGH